MTKPKICNDNEKQPAVPEFCDFGFWEVPVNSLSEIKEANRDHAYILPDNSVWVLSHDGKKFIQLNLGGTGGNQPTLLENSDGLIAVNGSGTNNLSVDLNLPEVGEALGINEISESIAKHVNNAEMHVTSAEKNRWEKKQEKLTAGKNISIEKNVISAIGGKSYGFHIVENSEDSIIQLVMDGNYEQEGLKAQFNTTSRIIMPDVNYNEETGQTILEFHFGDNPLEFAKIEVFNNERETIYTKNIIIPDLTVTSPNDFAYIKGSDIDGVNIIEYIRELSKGVNSNGKPTQITNTDGYLEVSGSGTHAVTTNLNTENIVELVKEKIDIPVVKPDGKTITMDKNGVLTSVFPEAPLDGNTYIRQNGKWVKNFSYPNVYYELDSLTNNQLEFNIAVKDNVQNYKVIFADTKVPLSQQDTSISGKILFDRTSTEKSKTSVQFYYIKNGVNELFYTVDLKPLFKLLAPQVSDSSKYVDRSEAVTFEETEYFAIEDKNIIKQDKTVFFSVNLSSIKPFIFSKNDKFKVGKVSDPELFPMSRMAVNMVTENTRSSIYANTAIIIETNGDIMLVNTSDVSIGSAFNFRVGNTHFINMTYVTL
ncbi:hypothetical protein [Candidatus Enterococcus ikei]|uniref:Uncharacterized protein n=1 Tax=Candidatus Enterococcus ikei TaxID=2815326 RepID=A0ABS3H2A3_9ENTE|nr:hypothetical protein [Enterococcus sp. DIV0869a]MBO0441658.1 hypothetical protein [Enterococcus sp. DIV0869a]